MTNRWAVRDHPTLQPAPIPTVIAMTDLSGGWWTGLPRTCEHCSGDLYLDPPTLGVPGRIVCYLCSRELCSERGSVLVLSERPRLMTSKEFAALPAEKRGRPSQQALKMRAWRAQREGS